jgi:hypothetical protein
VTSNWEEPTYIHSSSHIRPETKCLPQRFDVISQHVITIHAQEFSDPYVPLVSLSVGFFSAPAPLRSGMLCIAYADYRCRLHRTALPRPPSWQDQVKRLPASILTSHVRVTLSLTPFFLQYAEGLSCVPASSPQTNAKRLCMYGEGETCERGQCLLCLLVVLLNRFPLSFPALSFRLTLPHPDFPVLRDFLFSILTCLCPFWAGWRGMAIVSHCLLQFLFLPVCLVGM